MGHPPESSDPGQDDASRPLAAAETLLDFAATAGAGDHRRTSGDEGADPSADAHVAPGTALGRYIVLGQLGAGGIGVVYLAYDPELDRKIALKLLAERGSGRDDAQGRLVREARAMARLRHPNVVTVHDVGLHGQCVYIAMEYLDGVTLGTWLKEQHRDWRAVVERFVAAGRGLAAAHRANFVHRDFKPDNVMLDADGGVRVMDFGLVRAQGDEPETAPPVGDDAPGLAARSRLSDSSLTLTGRMMGTPAYMSPEQHVSSEVDARSDQFSFCVSLYEGLYRRLPFSGRTPMELATAVIAGRVQPPPSHGGVPAWLQRIVMRGLSTDPAARFATMDELLAQIEAHLRPRRARLAALVAPVGLLALGLWWSRAESKPALCTDLGDAFAAAWDPDRGETLRQRFVATGLPFAASAAAQVSAALSRRADAWTAARVRACEDTQVRGVQSQQTMDLRMRCLDRRLHETEALIGALADADADAVESAVDALATLRPVTLCDDLDGIEAREALPVDPERRRALSQLERDQLAAHSRLATGQLDRAQELVTLLVPRARALDFPRVTADVLYLHALVEAARGRSEPALAAYREAVQAAAAGHNDDTAILALCHLAALLGEDLARWGEAEAYIDAARALAGRVGATPERMIGVSLAAGNIDLSVGRVREAEAAYLKALELSRAVEGERSLAVAHVQNNLAGLLDEVGRSDEALPHYRASIELLEEILGREHPDVALAALNYGSVLYKLGRPDDALLHLRHSLAVRERLLGVEHPGTANARCHIGVALARAGRDDEAVPHLEQARAVWQRVLPPEHPNHAYPLIELARIARRRGDYAGARTWLEQALALRSAVFGETHRDVADAIGELAALDAAEGLRASAIARHHQAIDMAERTRPGDSIEVARLRFGYAQVLWSDDPTARTHARGEATRARAALARYLAPDHAELRAIDDWLAQHPA